MTFHIERQLRSLQIYLQHLDPAWKPVDSGPIAARKFSYLRELAKLEKDNFGWTPPSSILTGSDEPEMFYRARLLADTVLFGKPTRFSTLEKALAGRQTMERMWTSTASQSVQAAIFGQPQVAEQRIEWLESRVRALDPIWRPAPTSASAHERLSHVEAHVSRLESSAWQ